MILIALKAAKLAHKMSWKKKKSFMIAFSILKFWINRMKIYRIIYIVSYIEIKISKMSKIFYNQSQIMINLQNNKLILIKSLEFFSWLISLRIQI
jgi:hypothetical protein